MADLGAEVSLDYKDLEKLLKKFDAQMPGIAMKLIREVNKEAKKEIKKAYRAKGYKAHIEKTYGDAGYITNLVSYANRDFSASIVMKKNAFHYKFLEFGTNHKEMTVRRNGKAYRVKGFSIPANPILYPIANSIWKTQKAEKIMEAKFQKEIEKLGGNK